MAAGRRTHIAVGNLSVRRDFGYAPRYVEAMYLMLQHERPGDFIVCTGRSVSLRDIACHVCDRIGIKHTILRQDAALFRPHDIPDIYGVNARAGEVLGWKYELSIFDVLDRLISEEMEAMGEARS